MGRRTKTLALYIVGWAFLILGVLGLFLPVLQGVLFLAVGMVIMSHVSPWFREKLTVFERIFPKYSSQIRVARIRAMLIVRRILGPTGSAFSKKDDQT
ncbi:MAG: hypothetical protein CMP14_09795 [Rickettsiales bacterium]|jgi:uncharacterized membrane protein YbaN (DUF454 family)|nr:hypothetical protein [Rickettsiales bacterium]